MEGRSRTTACTSRGAEVNTHAPPGGQEHQNAIEDVDAKGADTHHVHSQMELVLGN